MRLAESFDIDIPEDMPMRLARWLGPQWPGAI
jgi:hypothetical protein